MAMKMTGISARALAASLFLAGTVTVVPMTRPVAQMTMNIAAVVNDDLITVYDLTQRISLVVAFSNLPDTPQTRQSVAPDVLRRLIAEKIRMQEARRLKIEVPQANIDNTVADIERSNGMPPGGLVQFMQSRRIDKETLEQQVRADLTWIQTVAALFRGLVNISDQEIEDELNKLRAAAGKKEYLLSEIVLSYDERPQSQVEQEAARMIEQLKAGASWTSVAQTFSRAASANDGGDIGWTPVSSLPVPIATALGNMQVGQVSNPVHTDDGIYIVHLRDTRVAQGIPEATPGKEHVKLHQLHIPIPAGTDAQTVAQLTGKAQQIAHGASDCGTFDAAAKAQGGPLSGELGTFETTALSAPIQALIANVPVNGVTQPMRTDNGVVIMMVCERRSDQGEDPLEKIREQIRLKLINEQLTRLAEQHEQKLRQQSFIDIRLR